MADENGNGRRGLSFTPNISLGNIISIVAMAGTVFAAWSNMQTSVAVIQNDMSHLKRAVVKLERVVEGRVVDWREERR